MPRQAAVDEQLVPEIVAEQRVKKPIRSSQCSGTGRSIDEVVITDVLNPRPQLFTRSHPVEDRLTEAKLEAIGQRARRVPGQGALEQVFGPAIRKPVARLNAQDEAKQPGIEIRAAQ